MLEAGLGKLAVITEWMRSSGLTFAELTPPEFPHTFACGAAIRWSEDDYTLVSVPCGGENEAYITGGVLREVKGNDRLSLLEACNDLTADIVTPACYLHDGEDMGWSIFRQVSFPVPIVQDLPQFFAALLQDMDSGVKQAREVLAERGITGRPWTWDVQSHKPAGQQCLLSGGGYQHERGPDYGALLSLALMTRLPCRPQVEA